MRPAEKISERNIERMKEREANFKIALSGLYVHVEKSGSDDYIYYECVVNGEIKGEKLVRDLTLKAVAFDKEGRVLGAGGASIYQSNFDKYDVFCISFNTKELPTKFRLFPLRS